MNMLVTVIVSAAIISAVVLAVRHVRKKGLSCSSCSGCPMEGKCKGECSSSKNKL